MIRGSATANALPAGCGIARNSGMKVAITADGPVQITLCAARAITSAKPARPGMFAKAIGIIDCGKIWRKPASGARSGCESSAGAQAKNWPHTNEDWVLLGSTRRRESAPVK